MADKKIGNSIFRFEQEVGIDSKMGNWGGRNILEEMMEVEKEVMEIITN
jgi:hypothetical protein